MTLIGLDILTLNNLSLTILFVFAILLYHGSRRTLCSTYSIWSSLLWQSICYINYFQSSLLKLIVTLFKKIFIKI